jgi:F0F1-type ATP synthase assembly protein I
MTDAWAWAMVGVILTLIGLGLATWNVVKR